MSAYVVAREHIDLMVRLILEGPAGVPVNPGTAWYFRSYVMGTADELGAALVRECVASVAYRYRQDPLEALDPEAEALPGPLDRYYQSPYTYRRPVHRLTVPEALKALDGYEYQSCEHPGWEASAVRALCGQLRHAVAQHVPGYDPAPWTWDASDLEGLTQ